MAGHSDRVRDIYAAFARGDVGAVLGALAPDISWTEAEGFPYAGTYVGPDAVLQNVFARIGAEWSGYTAEPHELVAEGDTVVAIGEYAGTYRATGKSFRAPFAHVWKFAGEQVARFNPHTETAVVQRALTA